MRSLGAHATSTNIGFNDDALSDGTNVMNHYWLAFNKIPRDSQPFIFWGYYFDIVHLNIFAIHILKGMVPFPSAK